MFTPEGVPGEERAPRADEPGFEDWIARCQAGLHLAARSGDRVRGRRAGARDRRGLPARAVLRPAGAGRRCQAVHQGARARTGARPDRDEATCRHRRAASCGRAVPDRAHRRGARRPASWGWPSWSSRSPSSDGAVSDLVAALLATDAAAARATKALLQQAPLNRWRSRRRRSAGRRPSCCGPGSSAHRDRRPRRRPPGPGRGAGSPRAEAGRTPAAGRLAEPCTPTTGTRCAGSRAIRRSPSSG